MGKTVYQQWVTLKVSIPASSDTLIDEIPLNLFKSIQYFINLSGNTKIKSLNLAATKTDTDVINQVYGISGDPLSIEIDTFVNGSNSELRVVNNEAFALDLILTRAKL